MYNHYTMLLCLPLIRPYVIMSIIGECNNKDCQFMHIDADTLKVKDCPWYDRGFCKHG